MADEQQTVERMSTDQHMIEYISCLHGYPTSDIPNISAYGLDIGADTTFIMSIQDDPAQPWSDAKVQYQTLSARALEDIPTSEMMSHDTSEFAKASHTHEAEYDWFKVWPDFGKNGKNKEAEVSAVLATVHFKNDGQQNDVDICLPAIRFDNESPKPRHLIGELMFVAATSWEDLEHKVGVIDDINDENFSGWVIPMGQTLYTKRFEFMEAKTLFGESPTAASFTVPNLAGLFMPTGPRDDDEYLQKVPGYNNVPVHSHKGMTLAENQNQLKQTVSGNIDIANGRASANDELPTKEQVDKAFESRQKVGIISPWWQTLNKATGSYESVGAYPMAVPSSFRKISTDDQGIFKIEYKTNGIDGKEDGMNFTVQGLNIEDAGIQYDGHNEEETASFPTRLNIPVLLYVGFPYQNKYKYWG